MNVTWRTEWPHWLLLGGMFLLAAMTWPWAPEQIPMHWSIDGQVDRYGGRFEGLLAMPLLSLVVYAGMLLMPRVDPGRANYRQFSSPYAILRLAILTVLAALYGVVHLWIRGMEVDVATIASLLVGGLLVLLGGLLGKIRPNWFVGVRTPWTLSSKLAWTKTHRLAGGLFIAMGVALVAAGQLRSSWALVTAFGFMGASLLWLVAYSYLVWRADPDKTPPAGTLPAREA